MTTSIVQSHQHSGVQSSPFDAIRGYRADGSEYWTARELMKWLGYPRWSKGEVALQRAIKSLQNQGYVTSDHVTQVGKYSRSNGCGVREIIDFELSRQMCYMVAMNADPEKEMVAMAQGYFAIQTRKAEVVIPAISEDLEMMRLQNQNLKMQLKLQEHQDFRLKAYGLPTTLLLEGKSDAIIEVDRPTIEVIDAQSGAKFSGQTTKQLAEYLNKNGGRSFKSGAELERELNRLGRSDLIDTVPRKTLQPFISKDNLQEACRILVNNRQQQLL